MHSFQETRLETERLVLRTPRIDDADALLEFVGEADTMRRLGSEPGGREEAVEDVWVHAR